MGPVARVGRAMATTIAVADIGVRELSASFTGELVRPGDPCGVKKFDSSRWQCS
jgi:hypothetical protein